jgi:hypothetical protein
MTDKWGRRFFKAGAVELVVLGAVHSLSLFGKRVPGNDSERQLLELMTNYKFVVMGSTRSMEEFLQGFSISFLIAMLGMGVLDLVLANERAGLLKRVGLVNAMLLAAMTANSMRYFFAVPTTFLALGLLLFALAWVKLPADETT